MTSASYGETFDWNWNKVHKLFQRILYFQRESSRAHWRLFLIQWCLILSVVVCVLLDSQPGELWIKPFDVWNGRGYFLIALAGLWVALMSATEFFRLLYGIKDSRSALQHYLTLVFAIGFVNSLGALMRAFVSLTFWHLLFAFFRFGYDYFVPSQGELPKDDLEGPIVKAGGPCFLVVIKDTALVLEQDGCYKRVIKPGFSFLEPFETIRAAVDLRPQVRANVVKAVTKDGIPVRVKLEIEFMIQPHPRRQSQSPGEDPFLFREDAVRRAAYKQTVLHRDSGENILDWKDLIMSRAELELQRILSTYVLDRLIEPEDANPRATLELQETPRREIQARLARNINASGEVRQLDASDLGVVVTRATLEDFQSPKEFEDMIRKNRIESWRAEWRKRMSITAAEAEAAKLRWGEAARAQAQTEMLNAITRGLAELDVTDRANLPHLLALRMIEALEQMALDPWAQTFVPEQTLAMLRRLRTLYI